MASTEKSVVTHLTHSPVEDSEFRELTSENVDILLAGNKKVGSIGALIVDRKRIPSGLFYAAFDGHSSDLQWVGCELMELRYGRTKLKSLSAYDDPEFDFMYISNFHVDLEYKADVAGEALSQFLHHPYISGVPIRPRGG